MSEQNTYEFKAEIKKLLHILSQSLYQHKEIFLRELISNSADALKKLHFLNLQKKEILNPELPLQINIKFDEKDLQLIISDTGIGMTKEDLISNLGTIAGSGSEKFMSLLKETQEKGDNGADLDIIGQFGVGFYSVFMVADKVEVITRSYQKDTPAYRWQTDGSGEFHIEETDRETRGTDVILHFREEEKEFLTQYKIESVIKKYSNFISYPIFVSDARKTELADDALEDEDDETEGKSDIKDAEIVDVETSEEDKVEEPKKKEEPKPVNEIVPLWRKAAAGITDEEYKTFYHYLSNRYDNYTHVINYRADGVVQFNSVIFIPESRSQDLMRPEVEYGPALYSKNILIMQHCKELIPQWMRFVSGVLDSEDIPLNISRDTIQTNRIIIKMENLLVTRFFKEMNTIIESDPEKYRKIWEQFGTFIKEGIVSDYPRQDKLLDLLRFKTSKTKGKERIGLKEYIARMVPDQKDIFYLVGENVDTMKLSPHIGFYNQSGTEVIFFDETIDNFLMMNIRDYKVTDGEGEEAKETSYPFKPIDETDKAPKSETPEGEEKEKDESEEKEEEDLNLSEEAKAFLAHVKELLAGKIIEAKISKKLYGNSCRLANPAGGMSSSMQRAMRYWTQSASGKDFQIPQKIFEFNDDHPMIQGLINLYKENPSNGKINPIIQQLFENSLLAEGDLPNPSLMVPRINQILEMLITGNDMVTNVADELIEEEMEKSKESSEDISDAEIEDVSESEEKDSEE